MASNALSVAQHHEKMSVAQFSYTARRCTPTTQISFIRIYPRRKSQPPHEHKRRRFFHQTLSHSDSDQENFVSDEKNKNIAENQIKSD